MLIGPQRPRYRREQQLQMCELLGAEFRRQYRYDPPAYGWQLEELRVLYRAVRDRTVRGRWSIEFVVRVLGERGLGPQALRQVPGCKCVPFPGAWHPKPQSTVSHWHDRKVRFCRNCGEHWAVAIDREWWPPSEAKFRELYRPR